MLAPEERHRIEDFALSQHVACGGLALALGHHPVFDANVLLGMRIGPARNITRRVDAGNAGFEIGIHRNAAIDRKPGLFPQNEARPDANTDHHDIGLEHATALQRRTLAVDRSYRVTEVKYDAVLFMQRADEIAHAGSEHAFHRPLLQPDDVDLDIPGAQRRRGLKPDETCTDHDGAA